MHKTAGMPTLHTHSRNGTCAVEWCHHPPFNAFSTTLRATVHHSYLAAFKLMFPPGLTNPVHM